MATIEIDGKTVEADNGKMIIEVADDIGVYIPRFCYHKKLSVAANCRMCLVEVENSRKPVPACATPITNGMKVFTKSEEAVKSQKAVMEFLLINHPLDCPICDQGGECELQDVSMGFGRDASIYEENKRAVDDDNLGTLIATEMTRCIHCTRCVRFGDEIDGLRELGAVGRGENMQIGTYVEHSMVSEVSGNIIDLCPVGALTSKPYRFTARPWELKQYDGLAPHDCLGSNIHLHALHNRLMRVVPRENETINETWLSDRDRFSYIGVNSEARAQAPKIKRNGVWETVDWPTALKFAADGISRTVKHAGKEQVAALASPSSTVEEFYLLQKLMRNLGVQNIDHRLHQVDFRDQANLPVMPESSLSYSALENQENILLFGCNIHREVPLAGLKVRKAFRNGASIFAINSVDYQYHFPLKGKAIVSPQELPLQLATLLLAMVDDTAALPEEVQRLLIGLKPDKTMLSMAKALSQSNSAIVTGLIIEDHPQAALLRTLIHQIEMISGTKVLSLTTGANSAGAWIAGCVPHRTCGGKSVEEAGLDVQAALDANLKCYILMGIDPSYDFVNPARTRQSILAAEFVVMLTAFESESIHDYADVILPMAAFSESSGTYINVDGIWQTVNGVVSPCGEARPAWKILRVLGNLFQFGGFDYTASTEILEEVQHIINMSSQIDYMPYYTESLPVANLALVRLGEWPLYRSDVIVRHAKALQHCAGADTACIKVNPQTAQKYQLSDTATVSQGEIEITLPLIQDERIATDVVWIANALPETIDLGHSFAAITIKS